MSRLTRADLTPSPCEAIELSWHDIDAWSHFFAIPSNTFSGRWHVGCVFRRVCEEDRFIATESPIPASDVPGFIERNEPRWAEGSIYRWPTNGLRENPLAEHCDYTARLFGAIGQ